MPTRINFVNEKTLVVAEDFGDVNRVLADEGAALVHANGEPDRRATVFASTIAYIEEWSESEPLVSFG